MRCAAHLVTLVVKKMKSRDFIVKITKWPIMDNVGSLSYVFSELAVKRGRISHVISPRYVENDIPWLSRHSRCVETRRERLSPLEL